MTSSTVAIPSGQALPAERFRPSPWGWMQVVSLCLCSCFFAQMVWSVLVSPLPKGISHDSSPIAVTVSCIGCFFAGFASLLTILLTVRLLTSEIRVSEDRFSWRTWRGVQTVLWKDVLDYFETDQRGLHLFDSGPKRKFRLPYDFEVPFSCLVKTPYGDCQFSQAWPHSRRLREVIVARAVNARAGKWGLLGTRPKLDLPTTFRYDRAMSLWGVVLVRLTLCGFIAFMIFEIGSLMWSTTQRTAHVLGWVSATALNVMTLVVMLFPTLFAFSSMPGYSELRRRWTQTITLTEESIRYDDSVRTVEARWNEITGLITTSMNQIASVKTRQGDFDFRADIYRYQILKSAIEAKASEFVPGGWQSKPKERLDQPSAQTIDAKPLEDHRFFSYRTRTMRGILFVGSVYFGCSVVMLRPDQMFSPALFKAAFSYGLGWAVFLVTFDALMFMGLLLTIWCWRSYFVAGIKTDADGITQVTAFGLKRILWTDVREVKSVGAGAVTWVSLSDEKQRIWFTPLIADSKELLAEIKRRTEQEPELS